MTFVGREPHHSHQQPVQGFVRGRDEGQPIDLPNWSMLVKVNAGDTLGRLTVLEGRMAPQLAGPPAHVHSGHDETSVVIEGRMRFRTGDTFSTAVPGETVFASRPSPRRSLTLRSEQSDCSLVFGLWSLTGRNC